MGKEHYYSVCCVGLIVLCLVAAWQVWTNPGRYGNSHESYLFYSLIFLFALIAYQGYLVVRKQKAFEEAQRAKGLLKYKGKWSTREQVFEWKQSDEGLVRYEGKWITPEEKARRELFESEQKQKGLVKFTDRFGQEHWDTPREIEILATKDFEEQQKAKGLVKYMGGWVPKDQADLLKFQNEETPETLAEEIAEYIRENSTGISLNSRTVGRLTKRFWLQKYRTAFLNRYLSEIAVKMKEAEAAAIARFLLPLSEELMQWAQNRPLMKLTRTDVKLFLMDKNIKLSTSLEQMLYREAKLRYRYLPPWKRD